MTNSIQIQSEGTVPSLNFSPNLFRSSSSGAQYSNVTVSVGEPLQSLTIKSTSDANVNIGTISKVNDRSFSFQILISDATPRGQFSITFEGTKLIGDVFNVRWFLASLPDAPRISLKDVRMMPK